MRINLHKFEYITLNNQMIQRIPGASQLRTLKNNQYIKLQQHHSIDLFQCLEQLYKATSQLKRSIYGVRLYKQKKQGDNSYDLEQVQLQQKTKQYITWCYLLLNWEYVSIANLDQHLQALPNTELDIEQIRLEANYLKFVKYDKVLILDLLSKQTKIQDNRYFFDSYDPSGKNQMLQYMKSLCKIHIGSVGYRLNGLIRIVESCQGFAGIATQHTVCIISLKDSSSNYSTFEIEDCIDLKWGNRGLYYLQKNGNLGLLERQTVFTPKINSFSKQLTIQTSKYISKQYNPQRIATMGLDTNNNNIVVMAVAANNPKKLILQLVGSSKFGMFRDNIISVDLKEISGEIMYKNLINLKGELTVLIVNGSQGRVEGYHQYKFGAI